MKALGTRDWESFLAVVKGALRRRPDHVARVVLGSACEAWLNVEAFVAASWADPSALPDDIYLTPECAKRDLALRIGTGNSIQVIACVEAKVVYPNKNLERDVARLAEQLLREQYVDEVPYCEHLGMLYGCWQSYFRTSYEAFMGRLTHAIETHFPDDRFGIMGERNESIVDPREVPWGSERPEAAMVLTCVRRKRFDEQDLKVN